MKKILITLTAGLFVIGGLTSCDKERTCVCHYDFGDNEKQSIEYTIKKTNLKEAEEICSVGAIAEGSAGQRVGATGCELK